MLFLRNLRHGLRLLRRNPSFAASAIAVMALGIGATTAVFSVVKGVLLTPLPYREPGRVVLFRADVPGYVHQAALNREEFYAIGDRTDLFESVGGDQRIAREPDVARSHGSGHRRRRPATTSWPLSAFRRSLAARSPAKDVGRRFVNAVTISYDLWERRFQRDPGWSAARSRSTTCRCGWWGCCRRVSTCIWVRASSFHVLTSGTRVRCPTTTDAISRTHRPRATAGGVTLDQFGRR